MTSFVTLQLASSEEQEPRLRGAGAVALILAQQLWKLSQPETAKW